MDGFLKRLITVCISLFLIVYVGHQAFRVLYNPYKTERIYSASVYDTVEAEGFVIRNEQKVTSQKNGYLSYTLENGSRVAKGGTIAKVFPTQADSRSQKQLDRLTGEIARLKEIQAQGIEGRINLDVLDKQIRQVTGEMMVDVRSPVIRNMEEQQEKLLSLMNKRQVTVGKVTDFSRRIQALTELKNQIISSYSVATDIVASPVAGYFVNRVDGFEDLLSVDQAEMLTVDALQEALDAAPSPSPGNAIGKVVGDYQWKLACMVSAADAGKVKQGTTLNVLLPFVTQEAIPAQVIAVNRGADGRTAVVLECAYMSSALSSIRREPVQIRLTRYEGLRVPRAGVIANDNGEQGVYALTGDSVVFQRIEVIYAGTDYIICAETNRAGYLRLYDDIVVEGKGLYDGKIVQ